MKKLISLILALVLCTGILAGVSFAADAMPTECTPEQAGVVVTHTGDSSAKYYFDTLTQDIITWGLKDLDGATTITLTKDIELLTSTATSYFSVPRTKGSYYGSNPAGKALVLDLGGHTLSYVGDSYLFNILRFGMTVKNGTIDYDGVRSVFRLGTSKDETATSDGKTVYAPVLNLENVHVYNRGTDSASWVIADYLCGGTINVKDSTLWAQGLSAVMMSKTDQSSNFSSKKYEGPYKVTINVENSLIGSGGTYSIAVSDKVDLATDTLNINVKDSTLVSNADAVIEAADASALKANGQEPAAKEGWSLLLHNGQTATGKAYVYGAGSSEGKLPFTDVAETAWYYTFVRDLYNAKVIAGMTETTFAPEGTLTNGQALKLITLAVGDTEQAATDSHWASGYLNNAMGKGWLYNEVNLDGKITRVEFCQLAAAAAGITDQPASNPFTDTADASVLALYNAGIINGMTETTFSPNASLTRAQISKIIYGIISR